MKSKRSWLHAHLRPDEENGAFHTEDDQPSSDDSDNNHKFWKLFVDEAAAEAKWKVSIWKTELDSLLVFAGLFAAVVSAFLVDLRFHLRPDPVVIALKEITSILNNSTAPDAEQPSIVVLTTGSLWYGSLVVTLVGALWCVLAQGWLGEILRERQNNPADRALDRWKRDKATEFWFMDNVITGVPLLTQIGLAMFLTGFVVQSFDDDHAIGLGVLAFVTLGAFAYAVFTFLPWFRPDCPYRTPLTTFLHLVPNFTLAKETNAMKTESKIKILVSRLNRSANDEIFCAAASMLDVKLESDAWTNWYRGVEKKAAAITDALSVRLHSFAHRVRMITEGPTLSKRMVSSGINKEDFAGALHLPIEQGVACLRALLRSIEASMSSDGDTSKSEWIKQDIDPQWISSKIFPETWRLLSLSIHITRLVAKKEDYGKDNIVETDWQNMIQETFSDLTLRTISGASACRGLLQGGENLKRVCALGLAMFIEIRATTATDLPKHIFDDISAVERGKEITTKLWYELVAIWKNSVVQLVYEVHEWDKPENSIVELLKKDLYKTPDVTVSIITTTFEQLESANWSNQKQAIKKLVKLLEYDMFTEDAEINGVILKVISKLKGDNEDVRSAANAALLGLSTQEIYHSDMKPAIPNIIEQLDDDSWEIRKQSIQIVEKLSGFEMFRESLNHLAESNGPPRAIPKVVAKLGDDDDDVRTAAVAALIELTSYELYHSNIASSIPNIIMQLDDDNWEIRVQTVKILTKLSEFQIFRESLNTAGAIPKIIFKLEDDDPDVCDAADAALRAFNAHELYHADIKSSILTIVEKLDDESWEIREQTITILGKFSELDMFRESFNLTGAIPKVVSKLEDDDSDVRNAAVEALKSFTAHELYRSDIKSSIPTIVNQLDHQSWATRLEAARMLTILSDYNVFQETIKNNGAMTKLIAKLKDSDDGVRTEAVKALLALDTKSHFKEEMKTDNIGPNILDKLFDHEDGVRSAAIHAIKSSIPIRTLVKQLQDTSWTARQQAVQLLAQLASHVDFQADLNAEKTVSVLATMLTADGDSDVRAAVVEALLVFGAQEIFQKALKSEKVVLKLTAKLSDYSVVRDAVKSTLLELSGKDFYQEDIKSSMSNIVKQLDDKVWTTRQIVIQILGNLSEQPIFHETMKTEMIVSKLVVKLGDRDEDVRAAAAQALSTLGTIDKSPFKQLMKDAVPKLVARLADGHKKVCTAAHETLLALGKQEDVPEFLPTVVSTLNTIDEPVRREVYKLLTALRKEAPSDDTFIKEIDTAICKLLTQMKDKDLSFIRRSVAILTETAKAGLRGNDLKEPNASNRPARDAVETIVRSKLIYDKDSPDRNGVVRALSRLTKHEVFLGCLKPAIPGLIEAVTNNDQNIWSAAVGAISALSGKDEFRADLGPAVEKLIQKLAGWGEDEKNSADGTQNNMNISLSEDLLQLVTNFIDHGHLTMNDRIALASSLRLVSPTPAPLEVRACKLNLATVLVPQFGVAFSDNDYRSFLGVVLGNDNNTIKYKLSTLFPLKALDSKSSIHST